MAEWFIVVPCYTLDTAKSCAGTEFSHGDWQFNNYDIKVLSLIIEGSIKCYGASDKRVTNFS